MSFGTLIAAQKLIRWAILLSYFRSRSGLTPVRNTGLSGTFRGWHERLELAAGKHLALVATTGRSSIVPGKPWTNTSGDGPSPRGLCALGRRRRGPSARLE